MSDTGLGRPTWGRWALSGLCCLFLLWVSVGSTLNIVLAQYAPAVALRWWPGGAEAKTGLAAQLLATDPAPPTLARARALAAQALGRSPALGPAASVLGLTQSATGDITRADRTFAYAERVSRHDLSTELWLIQRRVTQGDVAGALVHYDIALRTNHDAFDTLVPILVSATANAPVRDALLPYLSAHVAWASEYAERLISAGTDPDSIFVQLRAMRLSPARDADHALLAQAVERLVALNRPDLALRLIGRRSAAMLSDGGFDGPDGFPPFDWWLRSDSDLSATRERPDGGVGEALHVTALAEQGGEVAHQLLLLPVGAYRFTGDARATADKASSVTVSLACAGQKEPLTTSKVQPPVNTARFAAAFRVPPGCSAQWLRISTPPATDVDLWLDNLSVTPVAPR